MEFIVTQEAKDLAKEAIPFYYFQVAKAHRAYENAVLKNDLGATQNLEEQKWLMSKQCLEFIQAISNATIGASVRPSLTSMQHKKYLEADNKTQIIKEYFSSLIKSAGIQIPKHSNNRSVANSQLQAA